MKPANYNVSAWYWIVAGSTTQVWSSAAVAYVSVTDTTYLAWLAAGYIPSHIGSEANLKRILTDAGLPLGSLASPAQQATALLAAGLAVTSTSGGWSATFSLTNAIVGVSVRTIIQMESIALILSSNATFADGATTIHWPDNTSTPASPSLRVLTPTQFNQFAAAVHSVLAQCRNYAVGVSGAVLPTMTATIA
jgi:hypothetical protein